jgi:DNA helicase-2/ATP-dependent DNA helicase PcrA
VPTQSPEALLESLDPEQREVARALHGPVCVLAGAGTGKTRAITSRIAYGVATGVYAPAQVLAVTFTSRAAGEMRSRLRELGADGVQARTFHSAALRQARFFWPRVFGGELPELTASKMSLLAEATRRCRVPAEQALLRDLAGEVEWAKVSNVRPQDYARLAGSQSRQVSGLDARTVSAVFAAYEEVKRERGRIDMEDVLLCTAALLTEDPAVAAQVRSQYRWLVVDEFQDVSPLQVSLLDLWRGDREDLCVVGDPLQTIYSFAGAAPDHLTGFARRHPNATTIKLWRNYRSTPQVVTAANRVFPARPGGVVLQSMQADGAAVTCTPCPDEVAEAEQVAASVADRRAAGVPLSSMAVLFRVNAQSEAYEEALAARGLPFVVRGVERFFERPEVRQALTLLRGAARATSMGDGLTAAVARDERGGSELVAEVTAVLSSMGWTAAPPVGRGAQRDRWESLQALVAMAAERADASPGTSTTDADRAVLISTLSEFVADLDRRARVQHAPVAEGVTLATMHTAKGLEWDIVFLVGAHEGTVPIVYADTPQAVEEERRLFYVAVTRARRELQVSWSAARAPGGRGSRRPSRFLDGIRPPDGQGPATRGSRADAERSGRASRRVARCRVCGAALGSAADRKIGRCADCPGDVDSALFERLRAWRTEQASAQKVPAYCVVTDATLTAIAESRPTSPGQLGAIPGIGKTKLERYAAEILQLCGPSR